MTDIVGQDKPELLHYGTKGMKWGVRKKGPGPIKRFNEKHANPVYRRDQDIKGARTRLNAKRNTEIRKGDTKTKVSISALGEFSPHLSKEYRQNPDRLTAYHTTSGERAVTAMLAVGTMGMSLPVAALGGIANQAVKADQRRAVRDN